MDSSRNANYLWRKYMFNWFKRKSGNINSVLTQLLTWTDHAGWTRKDYSGYAREAYEKNVIAYHCISQIAKSVANIPLIISVNGKQVDEGDKIYQLIYRPNPTQSYKTFMRLAVSHKLVSGNTYILGNKVSTGRIMGLQLMRPDRVQIDVTSYNEPYQYSYNVNGNQHFYPIERATFISEVLHLKEPSLLDDLYGMSPISAAMMSIDQHNSSGVWNKKLLDNYAKPPGILSLRDKGDHASSLTQEQLDAISKRLDEKFTGAENAGRIPIFNYDFQWQSLGMTPTDMDWINGKNTSARDICLAFSYPAHLLGMAEGSTFSNVGEAKLSLYEETVIPIAESMLSELSNYLSIHTKQRIEIKLDLDQVSALMTRREIVRTNARLDVQAGLISPNEAREEIGYDPVAGGDDVLVPAGKLPLNFDMTGLDEQKFAKWLMVEGHSEKSAKEIARQAYTDDERN